jgi:hypothetical protein
VNRYALPLDYRTSSLSFVGSALLAVALGSIGTASAWAAGPRDDLLRLVPEDVGFCLVIDNLRGHGEALAESAFVKQFSGSTLGAKILHSPETQQLSAIDDFLQKTLHTSAVKLRDEILGDALVVAYRPGPPGKPEQEQGLFLLHAHDARLLADLVEQINALQKQSGQLKELEEREYVGRHYYRRVEEKTVNYYYLQGPILAFAPHEEILRQLIDLEQKTSLTDEPPIGRQLRLLGVERPLAALWLNPRAFEPDLQRKADQAKGAAAVALKTLMVYWKALDGLALTADLQKEFKLRLAVRGRIDELPPSARRFLRTAAEPSKLWDAIPEKAMLAVAGRLDVSALAEVLSEFLTEDARKGLHGLAQGVAAVLDKDVFADILPQVGPDWGGYVLAPAEGDKHWFPEAVAVVGVHPGSVDKVIWNGLNFLGMFTVISQNKGQAGPLALKSVMKDGVEVKYLVSEEKFPPGLQPAFGLKQGCLVLGSSPEAIRHFEPAGGRASTDPARDRPLVRLGLREVSAFLRARREPLVAFAAARNQISREEAAQRLDALLMGLQLFERVELSQRTIPGRVTLTLRVQTAEPLK